MKTARTFTPPASPARRPAGLRPLAAMLLAVALVLNARDVSAQPDRSGPPKLGPPPSLRLPPISHLALSNGIKVLLMEKHAVPLVQVDLVIRAGALMDPEGKTGLASMTAAMLTEGAGSRNSLEFADAIDFLGADISASSGYSIMGISLHTPLARLDSALALLADVTRRPLFPAAELDRLRKERLTSLIEWRDDRESCVGSLQPYALRRAPLRPADRRVRLLAPRHDGRRPEEIPRRIHRPGEHDDRRGGRRHPR